MKTHLFTAKSVKASHLRRRKYELVRKFRLPENILGGCLSKTHRRCGRANCHCADGEGHPMWSITMSHNSQRLIERIPNEWVEEVKRSVLSTKAYMAAVREVMAINLELLAQTRQQQMREKSTPKTKKVLQAQNKLKK